MSERRGKNENKQVTIVGAEETPAPAQKPPAPNRIVQSFDAWWVLTAQSKNLRSTLKEAIQRHFEARGFMESKEFDKGLQDFGINT